MDNWAIVIGINEYWRQDVCLRGAVRDAEEMCSWLLRGDGGNVPPRNLYLLLSPNPTPASQLSSLGIRILPATRQKIAEAINQLIQRSDSQGNRLFFYYAGHGISKNVDYALVNAIVPSDFTDIETDKAISLNSIYERFQATQFREQFFFIDACRNIPAFDFPFRIGTLPRPGEPVPPLPPQFIMYATSSGIKAAEIGMKGDERGAFTSALIEGFSGRRSAKVFDDNQQKYLVTWDSLFNYVEEEVKGRKIAVDSQFIQEPKQAGEHGSENPLLGLFSSGSFNAETLEVSLTPEAAASVSEIVVGHIGGEVARQSAPANLPIRFSLEPRTYSLRGVAQNFKPIKDYEVVPLYGPKSVNLQFHAAEPSFGVGVEEKTIASGAAGPVNWSNESFTLGLGGERTSGTIELRAEDQLAKVVLLDNSGTRELAKGNGLLYLSNVEPGFYRARLLTPEGHYSEKLFELLPGEIEIILLDAPPLPNTRLFRDVTQKAMMTPEEDNTIEPSEAIGPIANVHLSTILALAGGVANEKDAAEGYKLRQIGISSFQGIFGAAATSGVQILFGVEAGNSDETQTYLSQIQLACWSQQIFPSPPGQPISLLSTPGLGEFAWSLIPGAYWLSIQTPDQPAVAFSIAVLPDRLTLVIVTRNGSGQFEIYQYLPALKPGDPRDPRRDMARFPILQRSELIQRSYLSGRLEEPDRNAEELLYAKWIEPVAGALGSYILLKVNPNHQLLNVAISNMARHFGGLSDSHVLEAAYQELTGPENSNLVIPSYHRALDTGFPIFAEGLGRLIKGLERLPFDHPSIGHFQRIWEKHIPGLIWTAVSVEDL